MRGCAQRLPLESPRMAKRHAVLCKPEAQAIGEIPQGKACCHLKRGVPIGIYARQPHRQCQGIAGKLQARAALIAKLRQIGRAEHGAGAVTRGKAAPCAIGALVDPR